MFQAFLGNLVAKCSQVLFSLAIRIGYAMAATGMHVMNLTLKSVLRSLGCLAIFELNRRREEGGREGGEGGREGGREGEEEWRGGRERGRGGEGE